MKALLLSDLQLWLPVMGGVLVALLLMTVTPPVLSEDRDGFVRPRVDRGRRLPVADGHCE